MKKVENLVWFSNAICAASIFLLPESFRGVKMLSILLVAASLLCFVVASAMRDEIKRVARNNRKVEQNGNSRN